jgi:hypothetical protein
MPTVEVLAPGWIRQLCMNQGISQGLLHVVLQELQRGKRCGQHAKVMVLME